MNTWSNLVLATFLKMADGEAEAEAWYFESFKLPAEFEEIDASKRLEGLKSLSTAVKDAPENLFTSTAPIT